MQAQQRGSQYGSNPPRPPAEFERRRHGKRSLQQIHRIAAGRRRREHAQRT
jgi:hypothetical protein